MEIPRSANFGRNWGTTPKSNSRANSAGDSEMKRALWMGAAVVALCGAVWAQASRNDKQAIPKSFEGSHKITYIECGNVVDVKAGKLLGKARIAIEGDK